MSRHSRGIWIAVLAVVVAGVVALGVRRSRAPVAEVAPAPRAENGVALAARAPAPEPSAAPDPRGADAPIPASARDGKVERAAATATAHVIAEVNSRLPVRLEVFPSKSLQYNLACADVVSAKSLAIATLPGTGRATLDVPAQTRLTLVATVPGEPVARAALELSRLLPDLEERVDVQVPDPPALLHGVVVDATSRPIRSAQVQVEPGLECLRASSGDDGTFRLRAPPIARGVASVRAPGYARVDFDLSGEYPDPLRPLVVTLRAGGATFTVRVREANGSPAPDVKVELRTSISSIPRDDLMGTRPFVYRWTATTDASGLAEVANVTANEALRVKLSRSERILGNEWRYPRLAAGERREVEIRLRAGARVRGRLVDPRGGAVPGARVGIAIDELSWRRATGWMSSQEFTATASTDRDGAFAFDDIPPGNWLVGPVRLAEAQVASLAQPVLVPTDARDVDVEIVAYRDLFIRGRMIGADGSGVPQAWITVVPDNRSAVYSAEADAQGRFVVARLWPTEFTLQSRQPHSAEVRARPGDSEVILRTGGYGGVEGIVVDAPTGAPALAEVRIMGIGEPRSVSTRDAGSFKANDLEPGRWDITAKTAHGSIGSLRGVQVRAGETTRNLRIELDTGAALEVESSSPPQFKLRVLDAGGRVFCDWLVYPPTVARCLIEPGTLIVQKLNKDGSVLLSQTEVSVRRGEQRRIVLEP